MEIEVSGRNINVGDALTTHVEERLDQIADKYFARSLDAQTVFNKEGHLYRADVSLHPNQGISLQSRGEASEPYAAFEEAADRVEKQLRRYKRRLKNHHASNKTIAADLMARDAVFAPEPEQEDIGAANGHDVATSEQDDPPIIIAETTRGIPSVSVGDAVMLMDLGDVPTLMFRNVKSGQLEVVYRRPDGNIGWISPSEVQ